MKRPPPTDGTSATDGGTPPKKAYKNGQPTRPRLRATRPRVHGAKDALSPAARSEAKILQVLADPDCLALSTSQKIQRAGVCRTTWYQHVGDPLFRARAQAACKRALDSFLGPVLHALGTMAAEVSRHGHADRRLYLEMLGLYRRGGAAQSDEEVSPGKPGDKMSDEELLACFEGREDLLPPGLLRRLGRDPDAHLDKTPMPVNPNGV